MSSGIEWTCRSRLCSVSVACLIIVGTGCQWLSQSPAKRVRETQKPPTTVAGSGWVDAVPPVDSGNGRSPMGTGWVDPAPVEPNVAQEKPTRQVQAQGAARDVAPNGSQAADRTILAAGDAIEVRFYYTPDLDVNQVIRPDGYISMQLLGQVKAEGRTPSQLESELTSQYGWHLKNPRISVIVRSLYSRRIYVGGYVAKPGIINMPTSMSLMEAVVEAGGIDEGEAHLKNVIVIRNDNGQRKVFKVDMRQAVKGQDLDPFYLQPKDIVYVPRTSIARADQWVDQYINKLIPKFVYVAWYPFGYPYK